MKKEVTHWKTEKEFTVGLGRDGLSHSAQHNFKGFENMQIASLETLGNDMF